MIDYDKKKIREQITHEQVFDILEEFGGEPQYLSEAILSRTICHNEYGEGSRKLYYYYNTGLFHCYTGCEEPSFDIFELIIKIFAIQQRKELDLNDAVRYIAFKCGIQGAEVDDGIGDPIQDDWKLFNDYERIDAVELKDYHVTLKEYDNIILDRLNYNLKITPWLKEGIIEPVLKHNRIGFYPSGDQITIPHWDKDGRLVGVRGRSLCAEDCERYGKYRPLYINQQYYSHPLGMNLYNLNNSKEIIKGTKRAIIFESEKSCLLFQSYFGFDSDITVACCGSAISAYQMQMLLDLGVAEVTVAFDKQFKERNTTESKAWEKKLLKIKEKYADDILMSFIWDKNNLLGYKDSPIDCGPEKFQQLFYDRIVL